MFTPKEIRGITVQLSKVIPIGAEDLAGRGLFAKVGNFVGVFILRVLRLSLSTEANDVGERTGEDLDAHRTLDVESLDPKFQAGGREFSLECRE